MTSSARRWSSVAAVAGALLVGVAAVASATTEVQERPALVVASDRYVDGSRELLLLGADGRELRRLTRHTPQAASPAWSPDGRRIAFVGARTGSEGLDIATRGLWTARPDGSDARRLFAKRDTWWPTWSPDGRSLLFLVDSALWIVRADGSGARRLSPRSFYVVDAEWSPGGRRIAVSECRGEDVGCGVSLIDPSGRGWRRITRPPTPQQIEDESDFVWEVRWAPDGHAVSFMRGLIGLGPTPEVEVAGVTSRFERRLSGGDSPRWSPDGRRIAFVPVVGDAQPNGIAVVAPDGSGRRVVADAPGSEFAPAWTQDAARIVFATTVAGTTRFWEVTPSTGALRQLTRPRAAALGGVVGDDAWAPDGRRFALATTRRAPRRGVERPVERLVHVVTVGGGRTPLTRPAEDTAPSWSPDGTRIAFARREGTRSRIMVVAATGGRARVLAEGTTPRWAPIGDHILFERGGSVLVVGADGKGERLVAAGALDPVWAPDGRSVAFARAGAIWRTPVEAPAPVRVSAVLEPGVFDDPEEACTPWAWSPAWSPDGVSIAFVVSCYPGQSSTLFVAASDGSGQQALVETSSFASVDEYVDGRSHVVAPVWSPGGAALAYGESGDVVSTVRRDGSRRTHVGRGASLAWSPDGARLAFVVERRFDASDVWSMRWDGGDQRRITTRGSNLDPAWRP